MHTVFNLQALEQDAKYFARKKILFQFNYLFVVN